MKKFYLIMAMLFISLMAYAQYNGPGIQTVTVAEAKNLSDDTPVTLIGTIESFLGDEKYIFVDATGTILVEIDDKVWNGLKVGQNDTVEITGEVDKERMRVNEIDVKTIKLSTP